MTNRTFGVEIEFKVEGTVYQSAADARRIIAELRAAGLRVKEWEGYNHRDSSTEWKLTSDISAQWELVSPILSGEDGLEQIRTACKGLNNLGAKVDKTCGLHVHHGASDLKINHLINLYRVYIGNEDVIDTFMAKSRRENNNRYCRTLEDYKNAINFNRIHSISDLEYTIGTRYVKLNCESLVRHNTIEFRQHQGTTDFEKIEAWVRFTQRMVESAKKIRGEYQYPETAKLWTLRDAVKPMVCKGADEATDRAWNFLKNRATALA